MSTPQDPVPEIAELLRLLDAFDRLDEMELRSLERDGNAHVSPSVFASDATPSNPITSDPSEERFATNVGSLMSKIRAP
jgi:hypothetical protein